MLCHPTAGRIDLVVPGSPQNAAAKVPRLRTVITWPRVSVHRKTVRAQEKRLACFF